MRPGYTVEAINFFEHRTTLIQVVNYSASNRVMHIHWGGDKKVSDLDSNTVAVFKIKLKNV